MKERPVLRAFFFFLRFSSKKNNKNILTNSVYIFHLCLNRTKRELKLDFSLLMNLLIHLIVPPRSLGFGRGPQITSEAFFIDNLLLNYSNYKGICFEV